MTFSFILLWRSKRKIRISKTKSANISDDQFAKAELDAEESQKSDHRPRELPGDMAHELAEDSGCGETWELPENNIVHELAKNTTKNAACELPGDSAHELTSGG